MPKETIRIIGGQWRHRVLHFPKDFTIRPTPNRVRETLFNWLAPTIEQATCLDLFAGSGALGFEALSRGAKWVTFVDHSRYVVRYLKQQILTFDASMQSYVHHNDLYDLTSESIKNAMLYPSLIDIVFLDPPFNTEHLSKSLLWLKTHDTLLQKKAWLYLEYSRGCMLPELLEKHWMLFKQKQAGNVSYGVWIKKCVEAS